MEKYEHCYDEIQFQQEKTTLVYLLRLLFQIQNHINVDGRQRNTRKSEKNEKNKINKLHV